MAYAVEDLVVQWEQKALLAHQRLLSVKKDYHEAKLRFEAGNLQEHEYEASKNRYASIHRKYQAFREQYEEFYKNNPQLASQVPVARQQLRENPTAPQAKSPVKEQTILTSAPQAKSPVKEQTILTSSQEPTSEPAPKSASKGFGKKSLLAIAGLAVPVLALVMYFFVMPQLTGQENKTPSLPGKKVQEKEVNVQKLSEDIGVEVVKSSVNENEFSFYAQAAGADSKDIKPDLVSKYALRPENKAVSEQGLLVGNYASKEEAAKAFDAMSAVEGLEKVAGLSKIENANQRVSGGGLSEEWVTNVYTLALSGKTVFILTFSSRSKESEKTTFAQQGKDLHLQILEAMDKQL